METSGFVAKEVEGTPVAPVVLRDDSSQRKVDFLNSSTSDRLATEKEGFVECFLAVWRENGPVVSVTSAASGVHVCEIEGRKC